LKPIDITTWNRREHFNFINNWPLSQILTKFVIDKTELVAKLQHWGASIVRVVDKAGLSGIDTEPEDPLDGFPWTVSVAVRLSNPVMDLIARQPTPLYSSHYATRSEAVDLAKCVYQVRDVFGGLHHVTTLICGLCIKVCPWGNKGEKAQSGSHHRECKE
jgi:hypothetical protein